ncbi:MAG: TlpA family protein disulfide reductase [Gemmatimonadetes bacterium]|nr:TlpA family protein disulfide reductase [Gemmatimonadota bacterium]
MTSQPDLPHDDEFARRTAALSAVTVTPSSALRARILSSRDRGVRVHPAVLLDTDPHADDTFAQDAPATVRPAPDTPFVTVAPRRWARVVALAASVAAVAALGVLMRPRPVEAGMIGGQLTLSPAMPRAGEPVTVRYAAGATLGRPAVLRLRARVRTAQDDSYESGVPVITLGALRRGQGNEYTGTVTLADSFVYAALAVEDTAAAAVDDFGGRAWELLRAGTDGQPTLAALDQRAHDMMGRSWEEGLATVRRMVALYPDSIAVWSWLQSFEGWMSLTTDSTRAVHAAQAARFAARLDARASAGAAAGAVVAPAELGRLYWYSRQIDAATRDRWRTRLLRDAPADGFAVQERLYLATARLPQGDTAAVFATLDSLWQVAPRDRRLQVAGTALEVMPRSGGETAMPRTWIARALSVDSSPGHQRSLATRLRRAESHRADGTAWLRRLTTTGTNATTLPRLLGEDQGEHAARIARSQRASLIALGRALLADGAARAAADTFRVATQAGWEPTAFEAYADAAFATGDTATAVRMLALVRTDPSLSATRRQALDARVPAAWQPAYATAQANAPAELSRRVLADARRRRVEDASVRDAQGRDITLSALRGEQGLVVAFWSRECGPAVEALPDILALADALGARGVPLVLVAEQSAPDAAMDSLLQRAKVSRPMYYDAGGRLGKAFNNWGTPQLFVLDGDGRVAFAGSSDLALTRLRAEALLATRP